jgi:hypothetical protein
MDDLIEDVLKRIPWHFAWIANSKQKTMSLRWSLNQSKTYISIAIPLLRSWIHH